MILNDGFHLEILKIFRVAALEMKNKLFSGIMSLTLEEKHGVTEM